MGDSLKIQECEDCQRAIKKYGRDKLNLCDRCEHLFNGDICSCEVE